MNRYKSMEHRQQLSLMPMCLDDMVAPDNVVRAIDTIVDNMDILPYNAELKSLYQTKSRM